MRIIILFIILFFNSCNIIKQKSEVKYLYKEEEYDYYYEIPQWYFKFSKNLFEISDYDSMVNQITQKIMLDINPELKGQIRPIDENSFYFEISDKLKNSTVYEIKLKYNIDKKDYKDLKAYFNYQEIKNNITYFYFNPLRVNYCYASDESLNLIINLNFNVAVDKSELEKNILLYEYNSGKKIKFSIENYIYTNTIESNNSTYNIITVSKKRYKIIPHGLKPSTEYRLIIYSGIKGIGGNIGLNEDYYYNFNTYKQLYYTGYSSSDWTYDNKNNTKYLFYPNSYIYFQFNNPLDEKTITTNNIIINPKVDNLKLEVSGNSIILSGNFIGDQKYNFKISNIKDIYGQLFQGIISESIYFDHAYSYFSLPIGYMVMENYLPLLLPFKTVNVDGLDFEYYFIDNINEIAKFISSENENKIFEKNKKIKNIRLNWKWDIYNNYKLDLKNFINKNSGLLVYRCIPKIINKADSSQNIIKSGKILITDVGITVKSSPYETIVFVRDLRSNTPVKNATVYEIIKTNNNISIINHGKTDQNGFLKFKGEYPTPLIVVLTTNGSIAFNYGYKTYDYYFEDEYYFNSKNKSHIVKFGSEYYYNENKLVLFTDRYLYKPGEKVQVKGVLRTRVNDNWELINLTNLRFEVYNSRNELITNIESEINEFGGINFTINLENNIPTGYYSIYYSGNREYFQVEEFKPVKGEINIKTDKDNYVWGDNLNCIINSRYLFGYPIIKQVSYNIYITPFEFYSEKYSNYKFTSYEDYYSDYEFTLLSAMSYPDKDGNIKIEKKLERRDFFGDAEITINANTQLDDKSFINGIKTGVKVLNPVHVGINIPYYFINVNDEITINLIAINNQEDIIENQNVNLEIQKEEWKSIQKAGLYGRWQWQNELVKKTIIKENIKIGRKTLKYKIKEPGFYRVYAKTIIRGNQIVTENSFYVIGKGEIGWKLDDTYELEIETDKKEYNVGEIAKFLVKNPFINAFAIISLEREKLYKVDYTNISNSMLMIPVEIKKEYIPNIYLSVLLYTGRSDTNKIVNNEDIAKPSYRLGYKNIKVVPDEKRLNLEIKSDKDNYQPGENAKITIKMNHKDNNYREAELIVAVVDKGVLNLIDYKLPNLLDYFYSSRELAIFTSDINEFIYGQRYLAEKGEVVGGGGRMMKESSMELLPRKNFIYTAFYKPDFRINSKDKLTFDFKVPDNLTSYKIMGVAHTKDSLFGYGEYTFNVKKQLMLHSSLPSFIRYNDEIYAGAIIYNYTGKNGYVELQIKDYSKDLNSSVINYLSSKITNIFLSNNSSKEVLFNFSVPEKDFDAVNFTLSAKLNNDYDAFTIDIPVINNKVYETMAIFDKTEKQNTSLINISDNIVKENSKIEISLSPSAFTELKGNLDYLINYPYGCLEQKCSSILPLLLGEDIILRLKLLKKFGKNDLRNLVQKVIDEIPEFLGKYGFKYWKNDSYEPNTYLTVYTTFILTLAKLKGYNVSQKVFDKSLNFVKDYIEDRGKWEDAKTLFNEYNSLVKSFALYVCAMNNIFYENNLKILYTKEINNQEINLASLSFILKSLAIYKQINGRNEMIEKLKEKIISFMINEQTKTSFKVNRNWGWFYYTDVIVNALILQSFIEANIDFPEAHKVIKWLLDKRKNDSWISTHENAIVFRAFDSYLKKYENIQPNFEYDILLNQKRIINGLFKSRFDNIQEKTIYIKDYKFDDFKFSFNKIGDGILYYLIRYKYILKNYPNKKNAGFNIEKKIYDLEKGNEITNNNFIRGKKYKIVFDIYTPVERYFVVLNDPLPSGFEPIIFEDQIEKDFYYYRSFEHSEKYKDKVIFTSRILPKGSHKVEYIVFCSLPGKFSTPPTYVEEMYNPENYGYFSIGNYIIRNE